MTVGIRPYRDGVAIELFHEAGFRKLGHLDMFMALSDPVERSWKRGITVHERNFDY